jgi:hypothetical protein
MLLMTIVTPFDTIYPARFGVGRSVALGTRYRQYADSWWPWASTRGNIRRQNRGIFSGQAMRVVRE